MTDEKVESIFADLSRLEETRRGEIIAKDIRRMVFELKDCMEDLSKNLELADLYLGGHGGILLEQHLILCEIIEFSKKLDLLRI